MAIARKGRQNPWRCAISFWRATVAHGIFAVVPYCLDLIGAAYIETIPKVCQAFRPKP